MKVEVIVIGEPEYQITVDGKTAKALKALTGGVGNAPKIREYTDRLYYALDEMGVPSDVDEAEFGKVNTTVRE